MVGKEELYRYKNIEQFKKALTLSPKKEWILSRDIGGGKVSEYMPIEVIQAVADMIFREWNIVDENYSTKFNEIIYKVKINALPDYPKSDYISFTGVASKPIQCDKGSKVEDFPIGKKVNAFQYCLPAVRSGAISCAFGTLGNLFGRNVGRSNATIDFGFNVSYGK